MKLSQGILKEYCRSHSGAYCQNHSWLTMKVRTSAGEIHKNTLATSCMRRLENLLMTLRAILMS